MARPPGPKHSATNRLFELRSQRGWTQEQLAEKIGVTHATIQRLESGSRRMTEQRIVQLAAIFDVEPGELLVSSRSTRASEDERRAVDLVRRMTPEQRAAWFQMGDLVAQPPRPRRRRAG
jgi:transcriptional regulator with XRE-family HTH domain